MGLFTYLKAKLGLAEPDQEEAKRTDGVHGAAVSTLFDPEEAIQAPARPLVQAKPSPPPARPGAAKSTQTSGLSLANYNITVARVLLIGQGERVLNATADSLLTPTQTPTDDAVVTRNVTAAGETASVAAEPKVTGTDLPVAAPTKAPVAVKPEPVTAQPNLAVLVTKEPPYKGSHCYMFAATQAQCLKTALAHSVENAKSDAPQAERLSDTSSKVAAVEPEGTAAPIVKAEVDPEEPGFSRCEMYSLTQAVVLRLSETVRVANSEHRSRLASGPSGLALYEITQACTLAGSYREKRPTDEKNAQQGTYKSRRLLASEVESMSPLALYSLTKARWP